MKEWKILTIEEAEEMMKEDDGNLNLASTEIKKLPDNLVVYGDLDLSDTPIQSLPDNLTVGGSLYLDNTPIKELPDNLTVGGSLYLDNTPIKELPDNLVVECNLFLNYSYIQSLPDNLIVGNNLDLANTPIQILPNNLIVGGSLNLTNTPIKSLPDNLVVGGYLDLSDTLIQIQSLPDNLVVRDYVYSSTISDEEDEELQKVKKLHDGDYIPGRYLYADGILTHVKSCKTINGYTFYKGKIKGRNIIYDGVNYAHCKSFSEGIEELNFKSAKDRGVDQYKDLTLNSELTTDEMITVYRIITGACKRGTEMFVEKLGNCIKEKYTIKEAIGITDGQYGSEVFKRFFKVDTNINELC